GFVDTTDDIGYDTALTNLVVNGLDFYGVVIDVNSQKNIEAVAAWALTNERVFIAGPKVLTTADYTTIASGLASASNDRVLSLVTKPKAEFPAAALAALMRSYEPGYATYMYKTLRGIETDGWTSTQYAALRGATCVMYVSKGGVGITTEGWAASGEFLDIIEGTDWIK